MYYFYVYLLKEHKQNEATSYRTRNRLTVAFNKIERFQLGNQFNPVKSEISVYFLEQVNRTWIQSYNAKKPSDLLDPNTLTILNNSYKFLKIHGIRKISLPFFYKYFLVQIIHKYCSYLRPGCSLFEK